VHVLYECVSWKVKFMTVVEHTLEQAFSYRDFASEKKTDEIGRPVTCLTNVVKESKDLVMTFFRFLVQNSSLAVWL
jgi:hypothetical protein